MTESLPPLPLPLPTDLAPLPLLLAYVQQLNLRCWLEHPKEGVSTLVLAACWLVLAWRGSGRPEHLALLDEPPLLSPLGLDRPPSASTLLR